MQYIRWRLATWGNICDVCKEPLGLIFLMIFKLVADGVSNDDIEHVALFLGLS